MRRDRGQMFDSDRLRGDPPIGTQGGDVYVYEGGGASTTTEETEYLSTYVHV